MRYDQVVELLSVTYAPDAIGQEVATKTSRQVFVNERILSATEFYEAGRAGLRPARAFEVRSCDYAGERLLVADGVEYTVIRSERRGEWTRLTCERKVAQ